MDILSILQEYRIPHKVQGEHEHARHGWVQVDCPWCSPRSGRFRLGINVSGAYANCWSCGGKGLAQTLVELTHLSFHEVLELIRGIGHVNPLQRRVHTGKLKYPSGVTSMGFPHREYLRRRGFDPDAIDRLWNVKGIGLSSTHAWRLFIPIHHDGEIVSWTTRSIGDREPRYLKARPTQENESPRTLLYGQDYVRHAAIICEGPLDVWAIGPGAVATMGLSYSSQQFWRMSQYPLRVVCFDSEPNARKRAYKLADNLKPFAGETYVVELQTGKDAAEADKSEIELIRKMFLGD